MTPEEKLDSVIKSIEVLKLLYGDKLESLPAEDKAIFATIIIDVHRDKVQTIPQIIASNETEHEQILPVEEIVSSIYNVLIPAHVRQRRIRVLSREVVKRWREKYGYSIDKRPVLHKNSNTYGYSLIDWHIVRETLIEHGYISQQKP
jgi:hypothetical protein